MKLRLIQAALVVIALVFAVSLLMDTWQLWNGFTSAVDAEKSFSQGTRDVIINTITAATGIVVLNVVTGQLRDVQLNIAAAESSAKRFK